MSSALSPVLAPLLSVNEPEAQVVDVFVSAGAKIAAGDRLCTLETTKATFEVEAEAEGYVHSVLAAKGQQVTAGSVLFEISATPYAQAPAAATRSASLATDSRPEGLLISDKALRLASELGVSLSALPAGRMVTEAMVRQLAAKEPKPATELKLPFDANQIIIFGAGGHARTIIDLIRQANHYQLAGLVAEANSPGELLGASFLGGEEVLHSLYDRGVRLMVNGVGAVGKNRVREEIFTRMAQRGFAFPRIVHPKAIVEPSAQIAGGVQVFGAAFIGSAARVGFGAIVNTGALVSHDCTIGEYAHLTPGVMLAGSVEVGRGALIGMGVTTAVGIRIGEWARIGNGARLNGDVPPHAIVHAGATWP